jgi:hypothetical protein
MRKEDKFSAHAKIPYYAVVQEAFKPEACQPETHKTPKAL